MTALPGDILEIQFILMVALIAFIGGFFSLIAGIVLVLRKITAELAHKQVEELVSINPVDWPKKVFYADIQHLKVLILSMGLSLSLGFTYVLFEWKTYDDVEVINLGDAKESFEEVYEIPPTKQPPPPKPKIQHPEIVAVPDEEEIEQEIELVLDVELTEETVIEEVVESVLDEPEEEVDQVFLIVEEQPEPIGGMAAFYEYLAKHIEYPETARRVGVSGRVFVEFVVAKDGSITNARVVKGIGGGCDEEAVRVVKSSPKWKAGMQRGRPVKVRMTVPVYFKLE